MPSIEAMDLDYFLEGIKDLRGYLSALLVNYTGTEVVEEYLHKLRDVTTDPVEFVEMLIELRRDLSVLMIRAPSADAEILPAVEAIDSIMRLVALPER